MVRYGDGWSLDLWICHATEENVGQKAKQGNKKTNRPKYQDTKRPLKMMARVTSPALGAPLAKKKKTKQIGQQRENRPK